MALDVERPVLRRLPVHGTVGGMERQFGQRFVTAVADITPVVVGIVQRQLPVLSHRDLQLGFHATNTRLVDVVIAEDRFTVSIQPHVVRVALSLVNVRRTADADTVINIVLEGGNAGLHAL